jgi:hypothetical protein
VPRNHQQEISLNNNKTNETLVVKEGAERLLILHGQRIYEKILLISRHSSKVAKHKIEEDEKEIFEWAHNKRTKRIKLN